MLNLGASAGLSDLCRAAVIPGHRLARQANQAPPAVHRRSRAAIRLFADECGSPDDVGEDHACRDARPSQRLKQNKRDFPVPK